jgi:hypothetical protein
MQTQDRQTVLATDHDTPTIELVSSARPTAAPCGPGVTLEAQAPCFPQVTLEARAPCFPTVTQGARASCNPM